MIAAQHKNDIITTTRDTEQAKITEMGRDIFQDLFETVSIWRVTNVAWNMEGLATAEALSPFCVLVGETTRRVLSDSEQVTGPCGDLDLTFKL